MSSERTRSTDNSKGSGNSDGLTKALKQLDSLVEEAVQVYELDNEKVNIIDELYNSLKVITNFFGYSLDIPSEILGQPPDNRIILTASLDIITIKINGKSEQKRLDTFSFEDILHILEYAVPTMLNLIGTERAIINEKITFLRAATKKLNQIHNLRSREKMTEPPIHLEEVS